MRGVDSATVVVAAAFVFASGIGVPMARQNPVFRSATDVTTIYVTVRSSDGHAPVALTPTDFRVFLDNREVPVRLVARADQPLNVVLLLDISSSMEDELKDVRAAANAFVDALAPGDRAQVGTFGSQIVIHSGLSSDKERLGLEIASPVKPGGPTPLWQAIDEALSSLFREPDRRVVVVMTDGKDVSTLHMTPTQIQEHAISGALTVCAVGWPRTGLTFDLRTVVRTTGGISIEPTSAREFRRAIVDVLTALRSQYVLGIVAPAADGRSHQVGVSVDRPHTSVVAPTQIRAIR